jgi:hypothetical protein
MTLSPLQAKVLHHSLVGLVIGVATYLQTTFQTGQWLHTPLPNLLLGACGAGVSAALGAGVYWLGQSS